jgi:hypothetical protein
MALDLVEHSERHVSSLLEFFEGGQFLLKLLATGVDSCDEIRHIANGVRVEGCGENHPENGEDSFLDRLSVDVAKANSCQGLESPVERHGVLQCDSTFLNIVASHPALSGEVLQLCHQEPEASY